MKFTTTFALTALATASTVLAQPHRHQHRHPHNAKRVADTTITMTLPGPTVVAYELDGEPISDEAVCSGIADGSLKFADGETPTGACSATTSTASSYTVTTTFATSTSSFAPGLFYQKSSEAESSSVASSSTASYSASSSSSTSSFASSSSYVASSSSHSGSSSATQSSSSSTASASSTSGGTGVTSIFPDGELSCDTFPSEYGAVAVNYLGLGGWTGLQAITVSGDTVSSIVTGVSGQSCTDGMMCSYACPAGYQKSQWPSTQGSTGQSVGGISCSGGKLYLTNSALSSSLCIPGTGGVQVTNNAGSVVAVCRTDYPGTESETVPVSVSNGGTQPLACPDSATYFNWEGKTTSAQYYLNPPGYDISSACLWGTSATDVGNWAPLNLGVGSTGGVAYVSIFPNSPTTTVPYPGTVELQGNLSGSCKYENGLFYDDSGSNSVGCTVSVTSGTVTYVVT